MHPGQQARSRAGELAVTMADGVDRRTYGELEERIRRTVRALRRRGLTRGSTVAVILENRVEWPELLWAPLRSGMWVAPLNWHLRPAELADVLSGSGAAAVITSAARLRDLAPAIAGRSTVLLVLDHAGGPGEDLEAALAAESAAPLSDEQSGARLLYSSGTTGRPKGIRQPLPDHHPDDAPPRLAPLVQRLGMDEHTVFLNAAPAYHAAPFQFGLATQEIGGTLVHLERFDPVSYLEAIATHRVTHAQLVPTMLVRLLRLPPEVRAAHDLSSLRAVVTSGAPCSPARKAAATEWLGPVVHEYYGASEGYGVTYVAPDEAADRPGTVGRPLVGTLHIADTDGNELPAGEIGRVWFEGTPAFTYEGDVEAERGPSDARGWTTIGDLGRLDADGYLYLTGREGNMIISGGVNIYPQEIAETLLAHPEVADAAVLGIPDEEYGHIVGAIVEPAPGVAADATLEERLDRWCRANLASFKLPRRYLFARVPRLESGKVDERGLRGLVLERAGAAA